MAIIIFGMMCVLSLILLIINCMNQWDGVFYFAIMLIVTISFGAGFKNEIFISKQNTSNTQKTNNNASVKTIKDKNGNFYIIKNEELIQIDEALYLQLQSGDNNGN